MKRDNQGRKAGGLITITLRCVRCRAEQEIRVPPERGVLPGTYAWECFECQRTEEVVAGRKAFGVSRNDLCGQKANRS
jgi:hypothetical protein